MLSFFQIALVVNLLVSFQHAISISLKRNDLDHKLLGEESSGRATLPSYFSEQLKENQAVKDIVVDGFTAPENNEENKEAPVVLTTPPAKSLRLQQGQRQKRAREEYRQLLEKSLTVAREYKDSVGGWAADVELEGKDVNFDLESILQERMRRQMLKDARAKQVDLLKERDNIGFDKAYLLEITPQGEEREVTKILDESSKDFTDQLSEIIVAVNDGEATPVEGHSLSVEIEKRLKLVETKTDISENPLGSFLQKMRKGSMLQGRVARIEDSSAVSKLHVSEVPTVADENDCINKELTTAITMLLEKIKDFSNDEQLSDLDLRVSDMQEAAGDEKKKKSMHKFRSLIQILRNSFGKIKSWLAKNRVGEFLESLKNKSSRFRKSLVSAAKKVTAELGVMLEKFAGIVKYVVHNPIPATVELIGNIVGYTIATIAFLIYGTGFVAFHAIRFPFALAADIFQLDGPGEAFVLFLAFGPLLPATLIGMIIIHVFMFLFSAGDTL